VTINTNNPVGNSKLGIWLIIVGGGGEYPLALSLLFWLKAFRYSFEIHYYAIKKQNLNSLR
jgi:hypothetical protein